MGGASRATPTRPHVRQRTFDVEAAYLKGQFDSDQVMYARPPRGARYFVRGIPVVWRLLVFCTAKPTQVVCGIARSFASSQAQSTVVEPVGPSPGMILAISL